jgi:hypothetical protein
MEAHILANIDGLGFIKIYPLQKAHQGRGYREDAANFIIVEGAEY